MVTSTFGKMASAGEKVLLTAKRTECVDAEHVVKLVRKATNSLFGRVDVVELIEKANFALTLMDKNGLLVAQASLYDYPNVEGVDQTAWEKWVPETFNLAGAVPLNTMFLHFFVARDELCLAAMNEILRITFTALPQLQYVCLAVPKHAKLDLVFQHFFTAVQRNTASSQQPDGHELRVVKRHKHYPSLFIREAKVEDNDDLLPIFQKCSQNLDKQYGDFFISEMIESQDQKHRTIVAEVDGVACGFVSLSCDVDLDVLSTCFDLEPFQGLHRPLPSDGHAKSEAVQVSRPPSQISANVLSATSQLVKDKDQLTGSGLMAASKTSVGGVESTAAMSPPATQSTSVVREASVSKTHTGHSSSALLHQQSKASSTAVAGEQQLTGSVVAVQSGVVVEGGVASQSSKLEGDIDAAAKGDIEQEGEGLATVTQGSSAPHKPTHKREDSAAVSIQLFAMDEMYEMRSVDFLPAIFELFPDKDFVVLTQPYSVPDFPLLSHFTRATPLPNTSLSQELFVFHKCALLESFAVRSAVSSDLDAIVGLVAGTHGGESVLMDVSHYLAGRRDPLTEGATPLQALVATCVGQVVGVAVLRQEEQVDYLRAHYNLEDFVYFNYHRPEEHGHLHHCVLNPIFHGHTRHFLSEVLRLTHKSCLYYPLYLSEEGAKPHTVTAALPVMVQVQPRRQVQYNTDDLGINAPRDEIVEKRTPFALYHINRKLTHEPKIQINARIVVVGSSDTATSFLETLITASPHLQFNNLTLVSPHGLSIQPQDGIRFLPTSHAYSGEDHQRMALRTWLNVVRGTVVRLDRKDKVLSVITDDGEEAVVSYEYLLFTNGTQYVKEQDRGQTPPPGVFALNTVEEEEEFAKWAEELLAGGKGRVVVYGGSLAVYTAVGGLLKLGVRGKDITLVHPSPPTCFNNLSVEGRVAVELEQAGVTVHCGFELLLYNEGVPPEEGEALKSVTFQPTQDRDSQLMQIECEACLCLNKKSVDMNMFKAVNDAYLVFDRRLVVNKGFHTNDPCIFAAGPVTKFSRKYHAEDWTHANFQSKEVGKLLATALLPVCDPLLQASSELVDEGAEALIPAFAQPKIQQGILPGGLHYVHAEKPNRGESLDKLMAQEDYGRELVTSCGDNYFRLHVNQYSRIQTITCLNKKPMDLDNILSLYGVHEKYLNNLVSRFDEKLIDDFFSYFKEPWAVAVFHDRFGAFREEVMELLKKKQGSDGRSFQDEVVQHISEDLRASQARREALCGSFVQSPLKLAVDRHLLNFLSYNSYHLPMYAKPHMV